MLTISRSSPRGHGNGARDLLLREIVELHRDVADLPAIDLLGRRSRQQDQEALERIDLHAADADLLVALAQGEGRRATARVGMSTISIFSSVESST